MMFLVDKQILKKLEKMKFTNASIVWKYRGWKEDKFNYSGKRLIRLIRSAKKKGG